MAESRKAARADGRGGRVAEVDIGWHMAQFRPNDESGPLGFFTEGYTRNVMRHIRGRVMGAEKA